MQQAAEMKFSVGDPSRQVGHIDRHALRLERFWIAAMSSFAICCLMLFLYWQGLMAPDVTFTAIACMAGEVAGFYLIFRLGLNKRLADPSLTMPMTVVAVLTLLYVMYASAIARETFTGFIALILTFGVFRFPTRILLLQSAFILTAYACMLGMVWHANPENFGPTDVARWMTLATALPLFAWTGGKIMAARRAAMQRLSASEERFRRLTAVSSDWYWEQDGDFRFTMISAGLKSSAGVSPTRLIGMTLQDICTEIAPAAQTILVQAMQSHQPFVNIEYQSPDDNGNLHWHSISGAPLFNAAGACTGYCGTGRDITERKRIEKQVQFQAQHDPLTNLPNRILLRDRLNYAIATARREGSSMWVVFLDLDRFKLINDSLGHKAGDVLLQTISLRLQSLLRVSDTVARLGGDEFVLILNDMQGEQLALDMIRRIMDNVAKPLQAGEHELAMTCSIGIAVYPTDGSRAEELIEHADIAMYRAKEAGRGNFQFYKASMNQRAVDRLLLENALRNALQAEEFELMYQPQVELCSGRIIGAEALIRWRHPKRGLVGPGEFINVAEEMGLIVPIGAWVMRAACAQAKAWQDAGHPLLRIAVNLSARQFAQKNLVEQVQEVLSQTDFDATGLEIEITESLAMTDVEQTIVILRKLKALGIQLSIDDFGTGYSSLSYLKRFPIDVLKIDRSFVRDISSDPEDAAIVSAIIGLAHNLNLKVIAEGVEEEDQLAFLHRAACDAMQGYLFSRPVTAAEFEQVLLNNMASLV